MKKILVVSVTPAVATRWSSVLEQHGCAADIALSAGEARERASSGRPDLIVVDQTEISREIFLDALARDPSTAAIPVVALTPREAQSPEDVLPRITVALDRRRILIAEDDRQMAGILEMLLSKSGYEVRKAHDGLEALREIKAWRPHLLVLDIMLPIVDGFHVCQTMNEDHTYDPQPRVLIVSGRGSEWDQNLGAACGAEDYIVKPFNHSVFLTKVQEILAR